MTPDHSVAVVTDDTPRSASLTATQSSVAVIERDVTLLVAAVALVLNGPTTLALSVEERSRLRRLTAVLFRQLSAVAQRDVRTRTAVADGTALRQSARARPDGDGANPHFGLAPLFFLK